jgi:hypothetical protein
MTSSELKQIIKEELVVLNVIKENLSVPIQKASQ